MAYRIIIFLVLNFAALALGGLFTSDGVLSDWYSNLSKAPWTPPGWVFGAAWTSIMVCFSVYMAFLWKEAKDKMHLIILFSFQWILNVAWNPVFFHFHEALLGLFVISGLTLLMGYFLFRFRTELKLKTLLVGPYFLWLLIATSLNAYIVINN